MKVSAKTHGHQNIVVYLDGKKLDYAVEADDVDGYVDVHKTYQTLEGQVKWTGETERLRGKVEIRFKPEVGPNWSPLIRVRACGCPEEEHLHRETCPDYFPGGLRRNPVVVPTARVEVNIWERRQAQVAIQNCLHANGVTSAREIPGWGQDEHWAFAVDLADLSDGGKHLELNVGWLLGLLGVSKNTLIGYRLVP